MTLEDLIREQLGMGQRQDLDSLVMGQVKSAAPYGGNDINARVRRDLSRPEGQGDQFKNLFRVSSLVHDFTPETVTPLQLEDFSLLTPDLQEKYMRTVSHASDPVLLTRFMGVKPTDLRGRGLTKEMIDNQILRPYVDVFRTGLPQWGSSAGVVGLEDRGEFLRSIGGLP